MRLGYLTLVLLLVFGAVAHADEAALPETSLYNLDEIWTRQDGAAMPLRDLSGKLVVAAMGYTICKDLCPAIVVDMAWIERHLSERARARVKFVFFSFDSEADSIRT